MRKYYPYPGSSLLTIAQRIFLCLSAFLFSFTVFSQPAITSFSPSSGPVGTTVTITGNNFSTTPANNIVFFGAVRANVSAATATSLTVTTPAGSSYQPISVTVNGLTGYSNQPFLIGFSGGTLTSDAFDFATNADNAPGIDTDDLSITDMDGDGKPDLVVVDKLNGFFAFYRNTSTGSAISFAPRSGLQSGNRSQRISVGDIDGDGKPDVAVVNTDDNTISVFRNTSTAGTISFAPKITLASALNCLGICIADFDSDGKPDLATLSTNLEGTISIIKNTSTVGSLSFAARTDFNTIGVISTINATDINSDGKPDLVITNLALSSFSVLRNTSTTGSISFAAKVDFASGPNPDRLTFGDLDADGRNDIVITYFNSNFASVYRNTSAGNVIGFAAGADYTSTDPGSAAINDLDGDGKPDLALLNVFESIGLFTNNSTSGNISLTSAGNVTALGMTKISSCDLNGDGKPDIAILGGVARVYLWKNRSTEPQITSFSPTTSGSGATITITGGNFTGVTAVSFGGVPASSFTVVNSTMITAVVGSGASGDITVTAPHGTRSKAGYTYVPNPVITSFTPTTGITGLTITITGNNFTGATAVSFGGVPALSFTVVNATTITAVVGSGASGNVAVTTPGGTASLGGFIYIPMPDVISFSPTTGTINTTVTITGNNFTGATDVRFGGIPAGSFNVVSPTTITATVLGGSSGSVRVTTPGGTDSLNGFIFISPPAPIVNSFSPPSGAVGTVVTITGINFNTDPALNFVYFGPSRAVVSNATANTLTVTVPPGATYNPISVTTNFLISSSIRPFIVTFSGGGGISANSFEGPGSFITGSAPLDVCISDLDGDNKDDLITANNFSSNISVLRNTTTSGNLSFAPKVDFFSNSGPWRIRSAEMDGDGKKDIVVIEYDSKKVSVFKNTSVAGTISFAPRVDYPLTQEPWDLGVSDFDSDGKPDLVVVSNSLVSVIRNTSVVNNLSFAASLNYTTVFSNSAVSTGDIDGDDKPDIIFLNGSRDSAYIMRNTSTTAGISFAPALPYATRIDGPYYGPTDVITGDLDSDNKPDMAIANTTASKSISVWKNNSTPGAVSFTARNDFMTGLLEPFRLAIEDMDGDGKPDIAFNHEYVPRTVSVIKNTSTPGTISFADHVDYSDNGNSQLAGGICTGDLDGDGRPEIIASSSNGGPGNLVYVYKNKTNGPHIISFAPGNGIAGNTITITGLNFTGATAVSFGGVAAASFIVVNSTTITAVLGTGAAGNVTVTTPLGTASVPGFLYGLTPTITSFTPTTGTTGTLVTITGTNFTGVTAVSFGGISASSYTVVSPTTITATVSNGASGNVSVTAAGGTASLAGFTYVQPAPVINVFSPLSGIAGTVVSIQGTNFDGTTQVAFGGVPATSFTLFGTTTLNAVVGNGATGSVSVTTPGGTGSKAGFTFLQATISSFVPTSAAMGSTVIITGTNLTGATAVSFGGVAATSFTVVNATTINVVVGNGASGSVVVTAPAGTASLAGFTFIPPPPTVTSFNPVSGTNGTSVTITGTNFTGATAISFGGVAASSFTVANATTINAVVGTGASGSVSVTTPGGTVSLAGFTYNTVTAVGGPNNNNSKDLVAWPNPSDDVLLIKHPASIRNTRIRFVDMLGREIKVVIPVRSSKQTQTNVKGLSAGIYQIIWSDGLKILTRTFMVK